MSAISEKELAGAIRSLAMDAVQRANSGHPGMPLGFADVATILFKDFLKFSSNDAGWYNRDRFILSAGHGSMLIYALLYLTGYKDISLEDIKNFRQLGSPAAGHPEVEMLQGVETTTGPLGQGIANAVGMAMAERLNRERFGEELVNHHIYTIVGDGCLMEGIAQEAISFAAHNKLNKLIVLFDDNDISIDGAISVSCSENQIARFKALNWTTYEVDGHNYEEISNALLKAQNSDMPVFIACKTVIAYGSPNKSGSSSSHGSPLGEEEISLTKKQLEINYPAFEIPKEILNEWRSIGGKGESLAKKWQDSLDVNAKKEEFLAAMSGDIPYVKNIVEEYKKSLVEKKESVATRKASGNALEILTKNIPELIGGSADLSGSVNTKTSVTNSITPDDFSGRYVHYGIREHAMAAIMNGMALSGGIIPYSGTFLVFSDYCRPSIRLAALMGVRSIFVFTHDSIGLGEDGPTHQPVEHLDSLRLIPNLLVFRPCDSYEAICAWQVALENKHRPSILSLSRQSLKFATESYQVNNPVAKGGYIIQKEQNKHFATIIATGSEVEIAIAAKEILEKEGKGVRIISMVECSLFAAQSREYKKSILGDKKIVAIEASTGVFLSKYADETVAMNSFGASAPASALYKKFGLTAEKLIEKICS